VVAPVCRGRGNKRRASPARRRGQGVVGRVAAPVFFILSVCRGASMECDVDPSRVELGSKMFLSHLMGGYPWGEPSRCFFVSFNLDVLYIPARLRCCADQSARIFFHAIIPELFHQLTYTIQTCSLCLHTYQCTHLFNFGRRKQDPFFVKRKKPYIAYIHTNVHTCSLLHVFHAQSTYGPRAYVSHAVHT
jgi:hypothetical protein